MHGGKPGSRSSLEQSSPRSNPVQRCEDRLGYNGWTVGNPASGPLGFNRFRAVPTRLGGGRLSGRPARTPFGSYSSAAADLTSALRYEIPAFASLLCDSAPLSPRTLVPVCIAGMHRSGTSMITRLLNQCGLYLGAPQELISPGRGNPEGHWEHLGFVDLNKDLLSSQGYGWDLPPDSPVDWAGLELGSFREQAVKLISGFEGYEPWGWKDPRNCITLGFWLQLIPDLKFVVPVRDPLAVASSLARRNLSSPAFSFHLWQAYYRSVMDACPPERRLVTRYESFFQDPEEELSKILDFLAIPTPPSTISEACSSIRPSRDETGSRERRRDDTLPPGVAALYDQLVEESAKPGPSDLGVPRSDQRRSRPGADARTTLDVRDLRVRVMRSVRWFLGRVMGVNIVLNLQEERMREAQRALAQRIQWEAEWQQRISTGLNGQPADHPKESRTPEEPLARR